MLKDNVTITPDEANQIIRDLGQIEVDMRSILAMRGKLANGTLNERQREAMLRFAKRGADIAASLMEQLAHRRMPEGVCRVVPEPPKARTRRRTYIPKATGVLRGPLDFSGSLLSMLLRT